MSWTVALLLVAAPPEVAIHLEELGEVTIQEAAALATALGDAIAERTGAAPVLVDPIWPPCRPGERCPDAVRARTGAQELVTLRLYAGPTKLRLLGERLDAKDRTVRTVEENVPRAQGEWSTALQRVAESLFPAEPISAVPLVASPVLPPKAEGIGTVPIVAFVAAGALTAVGVGFGLSHLSAKSSVEGPLTNQEYRAALSRMQSHGTIANVSFVAAAICAVAGVVSFTFE